MVLALATIPLASCETPGKFVEQARNLPTEPAYVRPVYVAHQKPTDSCWVKHAEEQAGRETANDRMMKFRDWYRSVKKNYSAK